MSDSDKLCPLLRVGCLRDGCAWWTSHQEVTADGVQTEELCAIVETSRGSVIEVDA